jgi:hypothetical protein
MAVADRGWDDAVILGRYGDVPNDLAPYRSD